MSLNSSNATSTSSPSKKRKAPPTKGKSFIDVKEQQPTRTRPFAFWNLKIFRLGNGEITLFSDVEPLLDSLQIDEGATTILQGSVKRIDSVNKCITIVDINGTSELVLEVIRNPTFGPLLPFEKSDAQENFFIRYLLSIFPVARLRLPKPVTSKGSSLTEEEFLEKLQTKTLCFSVFFQRTGPETFCKALQFVVTNDM